MKTRLLFLLLLVSSLAFSQIPTTGLAANYEFTNGSLIDGANGNNFTKTGVASVTINDRFETANNAIELNGDHLTRSDINFPETSGYGHHGSISFWVKTSTNDSEIRSIFEDTNGRSNQADATWAGYYIYLRDGQIGFALRKQYNGFYSYRGGGLLGTTVVSDGNWHHVVFTISNGHAWSSSGATNWITTSGRLYVDGVDMGSAGNTQSSTSTLSLAQSHDTAGNISIANNRTNNLPDVNRYHDIIDDINIYTKVVTAAEVAQLNTNSFCFAPEPTILSASAITHTSATMNISDSGTYDIAYHKITDPFASAIIVSNIASGTHHLTGLDLYTDYMVYVRQQCANNTTGWSAPISFKTTRNTGRIYVNHAALGNNNGTSWADAYVTLNDALLNMIANEEIWVAQGVYTPDVSDRDVSFNITVSGAKIYGGFIGNETQLTQRDFSTNLTVLSGDLLANDDATIEFSNATRNDNSYNIITVNANAAVLNGLTITNGHANGSVGENKSGAAIIKGYTITSLEVNNCTFKNNVSVDAGAAIFSRFDASGSLNVYNSIFHDNLSRYGTSIYSYTANSRIATITVANSLFYNNTAKNNGSNLGFAGSAGWFRAFGYSSTMNCNLTNNTYYNNLDLGTYAGLNNFNRSTVGMGYTNGTLNGAASNCIFWGNTTAGGAIAKSIAQVHTSLGQNITVNNSIGQDGFSTIPVANVSSSLSSDPLFVDPGTNNFTVQVSSPALDAGDNSKIPAGVLTDLLGNTRIFNSTVDMGVYEFGASAPSNYTLTTNALNGAVANNPSGNIFIALTSVELTPTADPGFQFSEWSGDATGSANPLTITMDSNKNITAVFIPEQQTLTITALNGSVTTNPNPINGTYDIGASVVLTATPDAGYLFNGWTGDITGSTLSETIVMDGNKSVIANFIEAPTYVDVNATGSNDGTSWANAYTDLQIAINNTAVAKDIWVAKGIYKPSGSARSSTFNTSKRQKIYGGFEGIESNLGERDLSLLYTTNATILSGDLNGDDSASILDTEATRQDNVYHVITAKGNFASGGVLNGFIITGGNSNGGVSSNCATASVSQYDNRQGGAVYTNPDGANYKVYLKISNCIIERNTGTYYAALGRFSPCGDQGTQSHVDIESTIIRDNYSAISANISFTGNQQYNIRGYGSIVNSLITGNTNGASDKSSALIISSGGASGNNPAALVSVINTTITNNSSANNKAVTINLKSASSYPVYFYNSIIYNNGGTNSINIQGTNGAYASFANNIVEGGDYSSLSSDPLFENAGNNDFTLQVGSPAIDSGNNTYLSGGLTTDILGNTRIINTTVDMGPYEYFTPLAVSPKVFLQGPMLGATNNMMYDDLRTGSYLSITSPYSDAATCNSAVFSITGNDAIVDWIWVELRDATDNTSVIASQSALLQRDGDVVGVDGSSALTFNQAFGDYYIVIKHRNHLGVMTNNTISLNGTATFVDFTDSNNQITFGSNAQSTFGMPSGVVALWAGNVNGDDQVSYQGAANDTNSVKDDILAAPANTSSSNLYLYAAYNNADVDMNSTISYQGAANDSNVIKDIILSHPDNQISPSNLFSILEQLPEN